MAASSSRYLMRNEASPSIMDDALFRSPSPVAGFGDLSGEPKRPTPQWTVSAPGQANTREFQPSKPTGPSHLLIDTTSLVKRSMQRNALAAARRPSARALAAARIDLSTFHGFKERQRHEARSASGWQARRDAAVRVREGSSDRAMAARAAAEAAKQHTAKLERVTADAVELRPMPTHPAAHCCLRLLGCAPSYERPSQVHPHVFLGDMDDARAAGTLKSLGITHIVNMARSVPCYHPDDFVYTHIRIEDVESEDIRSHFGEAMAAIDEAVARGTGVLVHCVAGVSRSTTVVVAWLVEKEGMRLKEAFQQVRSVRPIVEPNSGFLLTLCEHELDKRGSSSVADGKDPVWNFFPWSARRRSVRKDAPPKPPTPCERVSTACTGCAASLLCLEPPG